ncbi:rhodanese-like domain-containing protein [Silvibacterium sp.]|uniref:rhodanese-like domain-containing protein n=1 Tax=Silvibacterium sp. TaxID=1964179 RepID=UPI0039E4B569
MEFEISPTDLQQILADKSASAATANPPSNFVLLDVREPWEFAAASIEGSILMPMGEIRSRIQELDPDAHIVTVCHHGVRSLNVALWLRQQDYENVQSLRGGIDAWSAQIDPDVPRY